MNKKGNVSTIIAAIFSVLFLLTAVIIIIMFMTSSLSIQAVNMETNMTGSPYLPEYNTSTNVSIGILTNLSFLPYILFGAAMFLVIGLLITIGKRRY